VHRRDELFLVGRATGVKKLVTVEAIKHYGIYYEKREKAQRLAINSPSTGFRNT
jgi:hypothetical protein